MTALPRPTMGRIVRYEAPDGVRVAIITRTYPLMDVSWTVDLAVFDEAGLFFKKHVHLDESDNPAIGTWHWPPAQ